MRLDPMMRHERNLQRAGQAQSNRTKDFTTEYGRWLDEHDREVAAKTLEDAADHLRRLGLPRAAHDALLERAAATRSGSDEA